MIIKIFLDTDIVYRWFTCYLNNNFKLNKYFLLDFKHHFQKIFWTYWFIELNNVLKRKWIKYTESDIISFLKYTEIRLSNSKPTNIDLYTSFIKDPYDTQILKDCIDHKCNVLLTYNTKDYHIKKIFNKFNIRTMDMETLINLFRFEK